MTAFIHAVSWGFCLLLFYVLAFFIRAFTATPLSFTGLMISAVPYFALCSLLCLFLFISSTWAVSCLLLLFTLYSLCFLSAVLSFSFVLFYAVLNFTYFIPLGCLPLLALFSLYSLCFCPWCCLLALFYSPLSLILLILSPWAVSCLLFLFTLFSAPSAVCRPSSSASPLSFCAFPSPLTLFSMHIFQYKVCIELIVTKFSHMAYN